MSRLIPYDRRGYEFFDPFRDFDKDFFRDTEVGFRTDIKDNGSSYTLEAELPGFSKEDISVDINGDTLTISASRSADSDKSTDKYVRRERMYSSMSRSFDISSICSENITAGYKDGILSLELPKKTEAVPASRRLQIS